jgi:hypothetical protein
VIYVYEKEIESEAGAGTSAGIREGVQREVLFASLNFVTSAASALTLGPIYADEDVLSTKNRIAVRCSCFIPPVCRDIGGIIPPPVAGTVLSVSLWRPTGFYSQCAAIR